MECDAIVCNGDHFIETIRNGIADSYSFKEIICKKCTVLSLSHHCFEEVELNKLLYRLPAMHRFIICLPISSWYPIFVPSIQNILIRMSLKEFSQC